VKGPSSPVVKGAVGVVKFICGHDVFERRHGGFAERHEFAAPSQPHMNFTTPTAPFTTGELGPFTTFSNSPPSERVHHR